MMQKALEGINVLDLSQFLSGPRCTQLLADMGASVIKLEPPLWGETMRLMLSPIKGLDRALSNWNRNKKGVTLDIRNPRGQEIYWKLIDKMDVVVENFAPGLMDKIGLSWDEHKKRNEKLIYCSITGFGRTGPYKDRVAFDLIAQASGGIMYAQKTPDKTPGVFFGDFVGGAYGAIGVLEAIISRGRTGKGQLVDISMQDVMYFHNFRALEHLAADSIKENIEQALGEAMDDVITSEKRPFPCWYSYRAKDGYISCVVLTDRQWDNLVGPVMNRPDLSRNNPKYSNLIDRIKSRDDYIEDFKNWFAERSVREIEDIMVAHKIPCSIVNNLDQVNTDPQLEARDMHSEVEHARYGRIPTPGIPIKLSDTPGELHFAAPDLGQHNAEIYRDMLGMTAAEIDDLKRNNII